jgi:hypothetical protein
MVCEPIPLKCLYPVEVVMRCSFIILAIFISTPSFAQSDNLDALLDAGHFKQLARAIDAKRHDAQTLFLLSKIKQSFGEHEEALRLAEGAVKADPRKGIYHLQLASVLSDEVGTSGIFKKISLGSRIHSELETALKLEPKNPDCLEGLMRYYEEAPGVAGGSKQKAREMAEEIGRLDPSRGYLAQAYIAHSNKQDDKLESLYLNAVKADPKSFEAFFELASYYASDAQKKLDSLQNHLQ